MMCPPGVDQTGRSEQKWQLIAPHIKQSISLTADGDVWGSTVLNSIFDPKGLFGAMEKLARPARPLPSNTSSTSPLLVDLTVGNLAERSGFESLPVEIVFSILESGDLSKADILSLALASSSLLPIIVSHIQFNYLKTAAPWAGTPIACVGNYTLDLPAAFMEDDILAGKFEDWQKNTPVPRFQGHGRGMGASRRGLPPARRFFWDATQFGKPSSPQREEQEWRNALKGMVLGATEGVEALSSQLGCSELFPKDTKWVLRNLTKMEYYIPQPFPAVTRKRLTKPYSRETGSTKRVHVPKILRFDDVLLFRTCWTRMNGDSSQLEKGSWAGDCFDIVPSREFDTEGLNEWRDVSKEVVEEARGLWNLLTWGEGYAEEEMTKSRMKLRSNQAFAGTVVAGSV
jgi:hypothetical protein